MKFKKLPQPRQLTDITKEYQDLCFKAGQLQYVVSVQTRELDDTNKRLVEINNEADRRRKLDEAEKVSSALGNTEAQNES